MRERFAQHDRRPQIVASFKLHPARPLAISGGDIAGAGGLQAFLNAGINERGHLRIGEPGQAGVFIRRRQRNNRAEFPRQRVGNFGGVFGHDNGRGVDATAAAIVRNGGDHQDR